MSILTVFAHIEWAFHQKAVTCIFAACVAQMAWAQSENCVQLPVATSAADTTVPIVRTPGQTPIPKLIPTRHKIAVMLSGGGARGLAHVGFLKELEAARIPIDFVAGISMGSIVGGLYAAGMTPAEPERRILAMNWDSMFADRPPREELSLRRKSDDLRLSIPLEFGMRDGEL